MVKMHKNIATVFFEQKKAVEKTTALIIIIF